MTASAQCRRCGRTLRSAKSIAAGYGPTCLSRIITAAQSSSEKIGQVRKALELIETGGIATTHRGAFQAVASNGIDRYSINAGICTCLAGHNGRRCYHLLAAELLTAAPVPAMRPMTDPFAGIPGNAA